jgi:hypothetical protein
MKKLIGIATVSIVMFFVSVGSADPIGGFQSTRDCVLAGATDTYRIALKQNEMTLFRVVGSGTSDIDCFLFDENGNLLKRDNDSTDMCIITVTPAWTGFFTLAIQNAGREVDCYTIAAE